MENIVIIAVLALVISVSICGIVKRIRYGSSCCGTREPADKKILVRDRNRANYPNRYTLSVDGMHCSNCARRIENAFNKTEGRWARADVGRKEVVLFSKLDETENGLSEIVASSGYTMLSCTRTS